MKKVVFITSLVLAVLAYTGLAQAESYVSAYAGAVIPHDSDADGGEVGYDAGFAAGLKGGHWFTERNAPYLGLELDVAVGFPKMSEVRPPTIPADVDLTGYALMANALLRYPEGNIRPYGGVGLGWFFVNVDDGTIGGLLFTGDDASAFAWQLLAGVDLMITPNVSLFAEYKYLASDLDFTFSGEDVTIDYRSSQVYGGVTYHF
ncbi:MAG: porin family protein [Anaerolineales bacterium]|jgi:opacity protein-like surface antigen